MKFYFKSMSRPPAPMTKLIVAMKLTVILLTFNILSVTANTFAQHLSIRKKNASLVEVFKEIRKQSGYDFLYSDKLIKHAVPVSVDLQNSPITNVLKEVFSEQPFHYTIQGTTIVVKAKFPSIVQTTVDNNIQQKTVTGLVTDLSGSPLVGATVTARKSRVQSITDRRGQFTIILHEESDSLRITSLGYKPKTIFTTGARALHIKLESTDTKVQDVIVTGVYSRSKESFTGSATTYTGQELKAVANTNIIQSLKTLDPVFAVLENNQFGSDPNRLPDLEIRGKSSVVGLKEEFGVDPNQPLFVLDGFETSLRTVMDLDMERVASITILKDAASTAIYGSKAANGVVVIETKQPLPGQLRISYNSNFNISVPDFSSYNLMNAAEKLQFERLAGRYDFDYWEASNIAKWQLYNQRLEDVNKGFDTYWLNEPIRTGINQRQTIYAEGGDAHMRYGIGANYNGITGVMKNSKRNTFSGNVDLLYRKDKFQFSNKLTINHTNSSDPSVPFSAYSRANPYYKKTNDEGFVEKWLYNSTLEQVENPLWNASLNSRNQMQGNSINNNFAAEYSPLQSLRVRARLGVTKSIDETDSFTSPENSSYDKTDPLLRGSLTYKNNSSFQYEGELTTTYGTVLRDKHRINAVAGGRLSSMSSLLNGYTAQGFSKGDYVTAAFAKRFPENGRPAYSESTSRSNSAYLNTGYSFEDRYLMDVTYRLSGSSVFGSNKRYSNTWSTGLAWNMHHETFMKAVPWINLLKIRGSIGNPGNQNFNAYQTYTTYMFANSTTPYFGEAVSLIGLGNPDLKWQTTLDKNVGIDATFLSRKLNFNLDYFQKVTDPLLINVGVPSSLGVNTVLTNLGEQQSRGFNGTVTYSPIYDPVNRKIWSFRYNFRTEHSKIDKIGNALDKFNETGRNKNLNRYYDGANPDALWTVVSEGIDPSSGMEIFVNKNGIYTLDYNFEDEVQVGIGRPKIEGTFGTSFTYKGFSANIDFRYRYGGQAFNNALFNKVENITLSALRYNQDRRALYDRWQKPGDIAPFKGISLTNSTPMSSRFVQDDNSISLESFRVGYEFTGDWMKRSRIRSLRVNAYMNELFVISSIKTERGIDYPFARTVAFSTSISF
ncbi:SusC/RagA family TonB-linked outer membrane protein [Sphingobacterium faecale]|uniref:SusC/RagA family TonB-linked outer membrane protein n=1 Tax=Sphingobacterium faecale TaxID=2803775 RepID=A0ABS1R438_9SPHI|nr:SusC/RagA family TonB-linked outer membrane protein [Sphingobacterium faecale]MBL1409428.1 SusC/RagA family TonB-linked outer membrane protein [Sphingobacterium faecale]